AQASSLGGDSGPGSSMSQQGNALIAANHAFLTRSAALGTDTPRGLQRETADGSFEDAVVTNEAGRRSDRAPTAAVDRAELPHGSAVTLAAASHAGKAPRGFMVDTFVEDL